jgi:hypothetical protein
MAGRIRQYVNVRTADAHAVDAEQHIVGCLNSRATKFFQSPITRPVKNYSLHSFAHRTNLH